MELRKTINEYKLLGGLNYNNVLRLFKHISTKLEQDRKIKKMCMGVFENTEVILELSTTIVEYTNENEVEYDGTVRHTCSVKSARLAGRGTFAKHKSKNKVINVLY